MTTFSTTEPTRFHLLCFHSWTFRFDLFYRICHDSFSSSQVWILQPRAHLMQPSGTFLPLECIAFNPFVPGGNSENSALPGPSPGTSGHPSLAIMALKSLCYEKQLFCQLFLMSLFVVVLVLKTAHAGFRKLKIWR